MLIQNIIFLYIQIRIFLVLRMLSNFTYHQRVIIVLSIHTPLKLHTFVILKFYYRIKSVITSTR